MKVLFVRQDHVGDCFLSLPAIYEFKKNYKNAEIHVLCKENTAVIFEKSGIVDKIHKFNFPHSSNPYEKKNTYLKTLHFLKNLAEENFDAVFNLRPNLKDFLLLLSVKFNIKGSFGNLYKDGVHVLVRNKIRVAESFGYKSDLKKEYVKLKVEDVKIDKNLKDKIIFHVGGSYMKKLPDDKIKKLYDKLSENLDIVLVKGKFDSTSLEKVYPINDLLNWAKICENARGVISFDTGPMHIAAAHSKKLFAMFFSTSFKYFGPLKNSKIYYNKKCNSCFIPGRKFKCDKNFMCMSVDINELSEVITDYFVG
jgi:ADP-heptose:LPS heptosyltransferase